jgi:hypothetical protein
VNSLQGRVVQQRREFGGVGYAQRLKINSLNRPASVKVDHPPTITTAELSPDARLAA